MNTKLIFYKHHQALLDRLKDYFPNLFINIRGIALEDFNTVQFTDDSNDDEIPFAAWMPTLDNDGFVIGLDANQITSLPESIFEILKQAIFLLKDNSSMTIDEGLQYIGLEFLKGQWEKTDRLDSIMETLTDEAENGFSECYADQEKTIAFMQKHQHWFVDMIGGYIEGKYISEFEDKCMTHLVGSEFDDVRFCKQDEFYTLLGQEEPDTHAFLGTAVIEGEEKYLLAVNLAHYHNCYKDPNVLANMFATIAHELTHLVYCDHDEDFWRTIEKMELNVNYDFSWDDGLGYKYFEVTPNEQLLSWAEILVNDMQENNKEFEFFD